MKLHLLLVALVAPHLGSLFAYDVDEITRRIPEIGKHPDKAMTTALKESPRELVALGLMELSQEQVRKVNALRLDLGRRNAEWEKTNGARFAEVYETMKKLRFTPGEDAKKEHDKWYSMKVKLARSRPRIDSAEVNGILTIEQLAAYRAHLATIDFWYGGHGEQKRIMMLVEAGAQPPEAISLFAAFSRQMEEYHRISRIEGRPVPQPSFSDVVARVKAAAAGKSK